MASLLSRLGIWPLLSRYLPQRGSQPELDVSQGIEEELLPTYKAEKYFPAEIGQVLKDRYQIIGKLGYGGSSTVWLSRDLEKCQHVALKLCVNDSQKANHELGNYKHLDSIFPLVKHSGKNLYRKLYDSFEIQGPNVPKLDLQARNMLLDIDDRTVFSTFEDAEIEEPAPRKLLGDRTIYMSRRIPLTPRFPSITDFGEARIMSSGKLPWEDVMPDVYRAPEIILRMPWDEKVDMWSIGLVCWDLVTGRTLFRGRNSEKLLDDAIHLAEMIAIMGRPPKEFLKRSEMCQIWWDENGTWRGAAPIPTYSLEDLAEKIGGEDRNGFLSFFRRTLRWLPEERPTTEELTSDPWLMEGLGT
ncbi:hypothetical protein LOZ52_006768 [Ophidiomyces ophidiicola]|nr:hypothetical protein LOZ64_006773 [Ophidiomyces ophidiicola]KAI2420341.1 hypothetical protein LOZ52_006768 [Ophidiomyces ophidiicola]